MRLVLVVVVVVVKASSDPGPRWIDDTGITHARHVFYVAVVLEAVASAKYENEEKRKSRMFPPPALLAEYWVLSSVVHRLYYVSFLFPK